LQIVVSGADREQDEIWDDDSEDKNLDMVALLKKWHVTLVDFGFARALTPNDMKKNRTPNDMKKNAPDKSLGAGMDSSTGSNSMSRSISRSISRKFTRKMSAIGNRMYAAPEITKGIERNPDLSGHPGAISTDSHHMTVDVTETLSDHVSFYGLLVDAYSIGNTIKYMMTGIPPDEDVNQVIFAQNHPIAKFGRFLGKKMGKKNATDKKVRKVTYRSIANIPPEVFRLIKGCTEFDTQKRTSVRMARLYPWIDDVLVGREVPSSNEVKYLDFVLKKDKPIFEVIEISEAEDDDNVPLEF
jgi:serine/threonine protein kinase